MLLFQKEAKQMANVAHLVKVNLTPSITLTPSVMFFFLPEASAQLHHICWKKPISVKATKTPSILEGQPCTRHLACLER